MIAIQVAEAASKAGMVQLENLARILYRGVAEGVVSDAAADAAGAALDARRAIIKAGQAKAIKPASEPRKPCRSPDRQRSILRRRGLAASGAVPGRIAANFTTGETAVLSVVARECQRQGQCTLHIDAVAARAGVSRSTVQAALRQARHLGLLNVQERRRAGRRSDANVVRIISADWVAWLKLAGDRVRKNTHHEYKDISFSPKRAENGFFTEMVPFKKRPRGVDRENNS